MNPDDLKRFWRNVSKSKFCWNWVGLVNSHPNKGGYGYMTFGGHRKLKSHRLSWEIHRGKIPKEMCVLHHCDNRRCVNPNHLFLGTQADNLTDRLKKCKYAVGENHPSSKFTESQVKEMIRLYRIVGWTAKIVGKFFGTSEAYIWNLMNGRAWKYLHENS